MVCPISLAPRWEYLNALKGYKRKRRPAVWVYRREGAPQFAADDPELTDKLGARLETGFIEILELLVEAAYAKSCQEDTTNP